MSQSNAAILSRRQFLSASLAVVSGGAVVSALNSLSTPFPAGERAPSAARIMAQGYRETAHTQAYYRAARL